MNLTSVLEKNFERDLFKSSLYGLKNIPRQINPFKEQIDKLAGLYVQLLELQELPKNSDGAKEARMFIGKDVNEVILQIYEDKTGEKADSVALYSDGKMFDTSQTEKMPKGNYFNIMRKKSYFDLGNQAPIKLVSEQTRNNENMNEYYYAARQLMLVINRVKKSVGIN